VMTVVLAREPGMDGGHAPPQLYITGADDQVIMLCGALGYVELGPGRCVRSGFLWSGVPHNR
jgi:hypothetical protein